MYITNTNNNLYLTMNCFACNKKCNGKPWLTLKNDSLYTDEEGNSIGKTIQFCSYLCSRKYTKDLPNWGNYIVNKADFEPYYLRPILKKTEKEFEYLTIQEIQSLTEEEKKEYYTEREKFGLNNTEKDMIYRELEQEDMNTYLIELENEYSSESEFDDY